MASITDKTSLLSSPTDKETYVYSSTSVVSSGPAKPIDKIVIGDPTSTTEEFSATVSAKGGPPSIVNLKYPTTIAKYAKYQVDFDFIYRDFISATFDATVFDPDIIDISIVFKKMGGAFATKRKVPAFYMVDFVRDLSVPNVTGYVLGGDVNVKTFNKHEPGLMKPRYDPSYPVGMQRDPRPWHVRFAPPETGDWTFSFVVIIAKDTANPYYFPGGSFRVIDSANKGYVKASERNFRFANGDLFYPIGVHANWDEGWKEYNRVLYLHIRYIIDELGKHKGNHARVMMSVEKFAIEHEEVNNYATYSRQERAYDLDGILEHAQHVGVYVQLVLEQEYNNAYGPDTKSFWTDINKRAKYKKKLRYILARWGYSTNVFAFEFMNEVNTKEGYYWWHGIEHPKENPKDSVTGEVAQGARFVCNWCNEMISYCKTVLQDSHMYTISVTERDSEAPVSAGGDFVNSTAIDFYTDHAYMTTEFQDHYINYISNRARYRYGNKPFIIGEIGLSDCSLSTTACDHIPNDDEHALERAACIRSACYKSTGTGTATKCEIWATGAFPGVGDGVFVHGEVHNAFFASALSGCSGAAVAWTQLTGGWRRQLGYVTAFVNFFEGEDLNLANSVAIRSICCDDDPTCTPKGFRGEKLPDAIFHSDIFLNNPKVEAFALKYIKGGSQGKIVGWVRNCYNWWYNLPHHFDDLAGTFCYNPNPHVDTLSGITLEIKNVLCNATYRVDFYSVYGKWPLVPGGPSADGGKIFSSQIISTQCTTLKFSVPTMPPILPGNAPFAPDYGFKITPISKGWGHGFVGNLPFTAGIQPFAVTSTGTQVAFRGGDGRLMCWYRTASGSYAWMLATIAPGGYRAVKMSGSIARGATSGQIYYHGADDRLQVAYWAGTDWAHTHLTDWGNASQNVGGDIGCNAAGGKIFYRGADGQLHMYLFYSGGWHHSIHLLPPMKRPAVDANFAVSADGNFVAFKGRDETLVFVWYDHVSGMYQNDLHSMDIVTGLVRMNQAGNVLFFRGASGGLHQVYYEGGWRRRLIYTDWGAARVPRIFDISPTGGKDNAQVYFRGDDGVMQVIYPDGGRYVQNAVISCMPDQGSKLCRDGGYIRVAEGMVAYNSVNPGGIRHRFDTDKNLQAYYFGKCDLD